MSTRQVAFAAVAIVLLAGCATPAVDLPAPSAPSSTSPTPTEPPLTAPRTALALTCAELFSVEELQALLVTPVQVRRDETSAPLGVRGATSQQGGVSLCVYGGEHRTNSSYDQGLRIEAVPSAAQEFDEYLATSNFSESARFDTFADRSVLSCIGSELMSGYYDCGSDFVVGDYWVNARMGDSNDLDSESAADLFTSVLMTVVDRMIASGPARSLWVPPRGADTAPLCSDPAAPAALLQNDPAALTVEPISETWQGVTTSGCRWTGSDGSSAMLITLQSGAWAFDKVASSPGMVFHSWLPDSTAAYDVPGTDGALVVCVDECSALVSWRGSLVQLAFEEPSYDNATAASRVQAWGAALP